VFRNAGYAVSVAFVDNTPEVAMARALKRFEEEVRRREIPHFSLHRRNFIALIYGVSQIFPRPRKIPL
jgi:hypothetical protein